MCASQCVCSMRAGGLGTWAAGDVSDVVGRPADNGLLASLDPDGRCIVLQLYDGVLKVTCVHGAAVVCYLRVLRREEGLLWATVVQAP
jgi:hypothetical protein